MDSSNQNGFFFELSGTTFSIVSRLNGSDTKKSSGFNGNVGDTYTLDTKTHSFEIFYLASNVEFHIDGRLVHEYRHTDRPLTSTLHFKTYLENTNSGTVSQASTLECRFAVVYRLGKYESAPKSRYINSATTTVVKIGPGILQKILTGGASKTTITVYDNTSASGTILLSLDCSYIYDPSVIIGLEFYTGLTVVTTNNQYGATVACTIVYE